MKTQGVDSDKSNGANVNDFEPNPKEDTEDEIKRMKERRMK